MHDEDVTRKRGSKTLALSESEKVDGQPSAGQAASEESPEFLRTGDWVSTTRRHNAGHTVWQPGVESAARTYIPIDLDALTIPTLVVLNGVSEGKMLSMIGPNIRWTIGAHDDKDLMLVDDGVSKNHAVLENKGPEWWLYDELSKNKTFVNNQPINNKVLVSGDLLGFGPIECLLVLPTSYVHAQSVGRGLSRRDRVVLTCVFLIGVFAGAVINTILT